MGIPECWRAVRNRGVTRGVKLERGSGWHLYQEGGKMITDFRRRNLALKENRKLGNEVFMGEKD